MEGYDYIFCEVHGDAEIHLVDEKDEELSTTFGSTLTLNRLTPKGRARDPRVGHACVVEQSPKHTTAAANLGQAGLSMAPRQDGISDGLHALGDETHAVAGHEEVQVVSEGEKGFEQLEAVSEGRKVSNGRTRRLVGTRSKSVGPMCMAMTAIGAVCDGSMGGTMVRADGALRESPR